MSLETDLLAAITPLCARVFPDFAPYETAKPYVTWQQVGGDEIQMVTSTQDGIERPRVQVNVWHTDRKSATELMHSIRDALRVAPLHARAIGALVSRVDELNLTRGAQQDFHIWRQ